MIQCIILRALQYNSASELSKGIHEKELLILDECEYKSWIDIGYALSTDENLMGTSNHFLYIGQKP